MPPPAPLAAHLQAVRDYWESVLSTVDKPTAKKLLPFVDAALPLGLPPPVKGAAGRKGSRPPLYKFYLTIKDKHPTKVVLVRVGEFYEVGAAHHPSSNVTHTLPSARRTNNLIKHYMLTPPIKFQGVALTFPFSLSGCVLSCRRWA